MNYYKSFINLQKECGNSSVGRASASQAEGRGFETHLPLKEIVNISSSSNTSQQLFAVLFQV